MPGSIAQPTPTLVMPQTLCTMFEESRNYEQQENRYHDGSRQAKQYAVNSRRTFKQSKRLTNAEVTALWNFYNQVDGGMEPFIFYNPYEGTPIGSNYDASGGNTQGRYVVCFRNNWTQSTVTTRSVVEGLEMVQLAPMSAQYQSLSNFGVNGAISSASITSIVSYSPGQTGIGLPRLDFAIGATGIGSINISNSSSPTTLVFNIGSGHLSNLNGVSVTALIDGTLWSGFGVPDPPAILNFYDTVLTVNYADNTTATFHPTRTAIGSGNAGGIFATGFSGVVTNANNVIDGNPATAGTITRTFFNGLATPGFIRALF